MNEQEVSDLRWQPVGTFRGETTTLSESDLYRQSYKGKSWIHEKTLVLRANSFLIFEVGSEECVVGHTGDAQFLHEILDKRKPVSVSLKELFELFEQEPSELKRKDREFQRRLLKGIEMAPQQTTEEGIFFRQACLYIKEHIYNSSPNSSKPDD